MSGLTHGRRSAVTCHLRCGDACAQPVPNTSDNEHIRDVASAALSRRALLGGAGALPLALAGGGALRPPPAAAPSGAAGAATRDSGRRL